MKRPKRVLQDWLLTPYRLAVHEPTGTAVIADVHLGYSEARQRAGDAVPLDGDPWVVQTLEAARTFCPFRRLLVAGDLFERRADVVLLEGLLAWCGERGVEWLGLVPGNHDRGLEHALTLPIFEGRFPLDDWYVVHDGTQVDPETPWVGGHWHPCIFHGNERVPCFLVGPRWLVLPAFSRDASGVAAETLPFPPVFRCVPACLPRRTAPAFHAWKSVYRLRKG